MLTTEPIIINISGDWVSVVLQFLTLILTGGSVWCAFRAYKHQKDRTKKEAACNLAKEYASSVIEKYADINSVFAGAGIMEMVRSSFNLRELNNFDKEELEALFKKNNVDRAAFEMKITYIDPKIILNSRMLRACSTEERERTFACYASKDEEGNPKVVNGSYLQNDLAYEIASLLNELEWFAMTCRYGLADEEILYQSLHKTFLSTVWMLYYHISSNNVNNEDKLYTNVIWLFCKWRDRLNEITDSAEARKQEYIKRAESVKPKVYEGTKLK